MKRPIVILVLLAIACLAGLQDRFPPARHGPVDGNAESADRALASAFENHRQNVQVQGVGRVVRILRDDNEGTRHQKFIIRLASGQELLVAHNLELAARVPELRIGDAVRFCGEYEWNPQGGVLHWTHRDPQGRHADGWLEHGGQKYQ